MIDKTFPPYADVLGPQEEFDGSFPIPDGVRDNITPPAAPVARNHWPLEDLALSEAERSLVEFRMFSVPTDVELVLAGGVMAGRWRITDLAVATDGLFPLVVTNPHRDTVSAIDLPFITWASPACPMPYNFRALEREDVAKAMDFLGAGATEAETVAKSHSRNWA